MHMECRFCSLGYGFERLCVEGIVLGDHIHRMDHEGYESRSESGW